MTNVNTQIYDKVIDRAAMVRLYERKTIDRVDVVINGHTVRIDTLIKKSKLEGKNFKDFAAKLDEEIKRTFTQAKQITERSLLDLFKDQTSQAAQVLDGAIGQVWRVQQPPRKIAEEIVFKQPIYENTTLEAGWSHLAKREKVRLDAIIREGIAKGQTENAIADTVMKTGYGITRNQARGLVVTATTSVYAQADHQVYLANEKALTGWQYVAVLDSRTTPLCAHRDGKIYPIADTVHLPPAHWHCRSTTIPIVKSYDQLGSLEGVAQIRKRNLAGLTEKQIAFYDGQTPIRESYNTWLGRQPQEVQLRHFGDPKQVEAFRSGQLTVDRFTNPEGRSVGIKELRAMTDSGYGAPGDTRRFALAKEKLDAIKLGAARPEELYEDSKALKEYYKLQAGELDGTLSFTNYRGTLLHNKKATRQRVLSSPPTEQNLRYNPLTGRYDDSRMYQPSPATLQNSYKLVDESEKLKDVDKEFIKKFVDSLEGDMGVNERAVITENLRITIGRFRDNKEPWTNAKAVLQGQIKFDVMNVSSFMETQARRDANLLLKLKQDNYIDPVLGPTQLQQLHDDLRKNIKAKNRWDDRTAYGLAKELRNILDYKIPVKLKRNLNDKQLEDFYLRFVKRLSLADSPDRDQLAITLGRDLHNLASYTGDRNAWYKLGVKILDDANKKGFYTLETFGVQKRRMKSRMGGRYFGPYYDTFAVNLKITNPKLVDYAKLTRKVEMGLRVPVTADSNRLVIREGYKTYFLDEGALGYYDTRIPITSTSSFSDFPAAVVDKDMTAALNWTGNAKYKVDPEFYDFVNKLLYFQDDKGKAQYYHDLNKYREYIVERGDAYERFKAMDWLRKSDKAFSNNPFLDHRARIYERGLIGPQSGETFRPFLSTAKEEVLGEVGYYNLKDQIGAFLGGASDKLEGNFNSLSVLGRQQIASKWHDELVSLGDKMRRGQPNDIRKILESPLMAEIDGEEQGKLMRFALEMSKIDEHLRTSPTLSTPVTEALLAERRDVAGLARLLGVENNTNPRNIGSISDVLKAQAEVISLAESGKIPADKLSNSLRWLHTADVELTDVRYERATYKTFDHDTGAKFSAEKIAENKAKFEARSKGNTRKYISMQVVEELGEFLEEHLKALGVKPGAKALKLIEAQKRALKAVRFGDDNVIKDADSIYFGKTNREAAEIAAKAAGLPMSSRNSETLVRDLNEVLSKELRTFTGNVEVDPYSPANLQRLSTYKTALALEQDASSSGAQIIALTTKNKELAKLSNVVPTNQKQRLYDEIAAATYNDPRFRVLNQKLGLTEKDLRRAAKAQNMVTFYGAGEKTGILNVEGKLGKALGKDETVLVVKAADRDTVLNEISARMARYEKLDPGLYQELKSLRQDVKDIFNKGLDPGDEIMEQLYFLDPKTRDLVEKLGRSYSNVVTPDDFKVIAGIMSENLRSQVPILKDFTKFFGRLANDYLASAKPKQSDLDGVSLLKTLILGGPEGSQKFPKWLTRILGIKNIPIRDMLLSRVPGFVPGSYFDDIIRGVQAPTRRRTGFNIGAYSIFSEDITKGIEIGIANKLDKSWTNVPWVNFDGKTLEQNFTQVFEEKLAYKDAEGNWVNNILQVPQKTETNWWESIRNKQGKINDIADANKAITAYAVNGNHSNDATIVKQFHLWGKRNNVQTSTVHDAFFANAADMLKARAGLRTIYAKTLDANSIRLTLDEMRARGLPKDLYEKYLNEAIDIGLIPVVGRSRVGGKLLTKGDILTKEEILENVKERFNDNRYWYGVG